MVLMVSTGVADGAAILGSCCGPSRVCRRPCLGRAATSLLARPRLTSLPTACPKCKHARRARRQQPLVRRSIERASEHEWCHREKQCRHFRLKWCLIEKTGRSSTWGTSERWTREGEEGSIAPSPVRSLLGARRRRGRRISPGKVISQWRSAAKTGAVARAGLCNQERLQRSVPKWTSRTRETVRFVYAWTNAAWICRRRKRRRKKESRTKKERRRRRSRRRREVTGPGTFRICSCSYLPCSRMARVHSTVGWKEQGDGRCSAPAAHSNLRTRRLSADCRGSVAPAPAALSFPCPATATTNGLGRTHVRIRPPLTLCSCAFSQCYAPNWGIQNLQNQACIPDPAQVVCMPVSDPAQPFVPGLSLESGRSRSPKPLAIINALAWLMEGCLPRGGDAAAAGHGTGGSSRPRQPLIRF